MNEIWVMIFCFLINSLFFWTNVSIGSVREPEHREENKHPHRKTFCMWLWATQITLNWIKCNFLRLVCVDGLSQGELKLYRTDVKCWGPWFRSSSHMDSWSVTYSRGKLANMFALVPEVYWLQNNTTYSIFNDVWLTVKICRLILLLSKKSLADIWT